jgi:pimeloyl-ACP methyl ester carboxylesterase
MIRSTQRKEGRSPKEPARFVSMGSGDRAVLLLHGLFGTPDHWRQIMGDLATNYRVVAPQLPVDHQPDRLRSGIRTVDELTDHVADLMFDLELPPLVICGNSLGGLVAIEICLRYPERVLGLVLAGSAGLYERSLTHGIKPQASREFVRAVVTDIFHDPCMVTDELVEEWHGAIRDRSFVRFLLRVSRATRDRTLQDELRQLKLPTLIVWGRNDKVTPPEVAEAFKNQIDQADLRYIDDCGHAPNLERPAIFSAMLQEFLPACFPGSSKKQVQQGQATRLPRRRAASER